MNMLIALISQFWWVLVLAFGGIAAWFGIKEHDNNTATKAIETDAAKRRAEDQRRSNERAAIDTSVAASSDADNREWLRKDAERRVSKSAGM